MSSAAVINATQSSGQTAGSPVTIITDGTITPKLYGTGSGAWSVTANFAPVVGGVIGDPISLTITQNTPNAVGPSTRTDAVQWVGWITAQAGLWSASGIVEGITGPDAQSGFLGSFAVGALPQYAVEAGSVAMEGGTLVRYGGAGVGWVEALAGLNIDATAMIPDMRQSLLAGAPLQVTADSVTAILGPTAKAQSASEYATLKTNRREYLFAGSGTTITNQDKLFMTGVAFIDQPWGTQIRMRSNPWPQVSGDPNWWQNGRLRYVVDGEGVFAVSYIRNTTNKCRIIVDGKILVAADTSGAISNAVASDSNLLQWVVVTLVGDKRRVITIDAENGNAYSVVTDPGITISKPNYVGKTIIFGDSFETRIVGIGETAVTAKGLGATALELLGYDVIDAGTGGTGFIGGTGNVAQGKGSYSDYIDQYIQYGVPRGFNPEEYDLIWMYGTGNDQGFVTTSAQYLTVIQKALDAFPNATIAVSSVYEGFNTVNAAKALNDMLYTAVQAAGPRVKWVPVDSYYKRDKSGVWSGAGSVPAPAYNGNADVYFSNATQGAADRHPNNKGVPYGAKYYATELIRAGIKYAPPQ